MPELDLRKLHTLHQLDFAILEIRQRAAALDPGRALMAKIKQAEAERDAADVEVRRLTGEQLDAELHQKGIDDKLKKFDQQLYGGKVVNPREVENINREVEMLKRHRWDLDGKILEVMEELPPIKARFEGHEKVVGELKAQLREYQKKVLAAKEQLEAQFKEAMGRRAALVAAVPAPLLARYEQVRQKNGGIGMADAQKDGRCGQCGTLLPTKTIEAAKEGRVVTCEACHRIVYATDGLV